MDYFYYKRFKKIMKKIKPFTDSHGNEMIEIPTALTDYLIMMDSGTKFILGSYDDEEDEQEEDEGEDVL